MKKNKLCSYSDIAWSGTGFVVGGDFPERGCWRAEGFRCSFGLPNQGIWSPPVSLHSDMIGQAFQEDRPGGKGQGTQVRCSRRGSDGTMLVCTGDTAGTERHGRTQVREGRSVVWTWGWVRHGEGETGNKVFPEFVVCVGIWLQRHSRWRRTSLGGKIMILCLSFVGHDLPLLPASRWLLSYKTWLKTWLLKKIITWLLQEAFPD